MYAINEYENHHVYDKGLDWYIKTSDISINKPNPSIKVLLVLTVGKALQYIIKLTH